MEVKISFDTEKENVDDLKRLIVSLQDLVAKREKAVVLGNPLATATLTRPSKVRVEAPQQPMRMTSIPPGGQTAGGGRVIPYQDLSSVMAKVFSGK